MWLDWFAINPVTFRREDLVHGVRFRSATSLPGGFVAGGWKPNNRVSRPMDSNAGAREEFDFVLGTGKSVVLTATGNNPVTT